MTVPSVMKRVSVVKRGNTYSDSCIRIGHHSDEHVQQDDDVDQRVGAEHQHTPEAREGLDARQLEGL